MNKRTCFILLLFFLNGCFYFSSRWEKEIYQKPPTQWDSRECLTVVAASMSHNLFDLRTPIKIIATPYYPSVIMAIYKNGHELKFNEDQYKNDVDGLLKENAGMYYDWDSFRLIDGHGNYFKDKTQIDSLMFLVTIQNRGYSNIYMPDITNLEDKMFLVNDEKKFIKPRYVWGKRRNFLTSEESLLAMFHLRNGERHFLEKSDNMYLAIKGFGSDINLTFPLSYMK